MLFNEPKLLKCSGSPDRPFAFKVSVLFNEPKLLKSRCRAADAGSSPEVSVLFNEPKLLKFTLPALDWLLNEVSVLFNEPKLLKSSISHTARVARVGFSALQRAEIAEIVARNCVVPLNPAVSVLFNEPKLLK